MLLFATARGARAPGLPACACQKPECLRKRPGSGGRVIAARVMRHLPAWASWLPLRLRNEARDIRPFARRCVRQADVR